MIRWRDNIKNNMGIISQIIDLIDATLNFLTYAPFSRRTSNKTPLPERTRVQ